MDYKIILLSICALIFYSDTAFTQVFKCIGDSGQVKYQSNECNVKEKSEFIIIRPTPKSIIQTEPKLMHVSKNNPLDKYKNSPKRALNKQLKEQKKQRCNMLRRQFRKEEKRVKDRCKKNREIFCDSSAVSINQNERRKAIVQIGNSSSRRSRSSRGGVVRIPSSSNVEIVQQEMKKYGCR